MIFLTGHQILRGMAIKLTERIHYRSRADEPPCSKRCSYLCSSTDRSSSCSCCPSPEVVSDEVDDIETDTEEEDDSFDDASVEDIKDEKRLSNGIWYLPIIILGTMGLMVILSFMLRSIPQRECMDWCERKSL